MLQYLLLRDNKQSGPYNFDELTSKGLKAYDLIWIEGKSAAWRYPSEIQELKPFAPVVEEQPYDRFYKRQDNSKKQQQAVAANSGSSNATANSASNANQSSSFTSTNSESNQVKKSPSTIANRRVVVILPNGMKENPADRVMFHETVENKIQQPEKPVQVAENRLPLQEAKKPVATRASVPVAATPRDEASFDSELGDFKRASANRKPVQRNSSRAPKILAGTVVLMAIGVLIGWAYNSGLMKEESLIPVALPRETVQLPEVQTVYNNETAQALENQGNSDDSLLMDEGVNAAVNGAGMDSLSDSEVEPEKKVIVKNKKPVNAAPPVVQTVSEPASEPIVSTAAENNTVSHSDKEETDKKSARKNMGELIKLSKNDFKIGAFGGISNLQLKVTNGSPYPVDLVVVEVKYLLANKKEFKTENIYFKNLAPGATATKEAPKSPRGIDVSSKIALITSKALGMYQASL